MGGGKETGVRVGDSIKRGGDGVYKVIKKNTADNTKHCRYFKQR